MPKPMNSDQPIPDISQSLGQLGETTTAAELVRTKGQSKKLKVITEKQLMEWVNAVLRQHMAGKVDSISDREKEELLKKTQDELAKRIKREQDAQSERDRLKADLDSAMAKVANAQASTASTEQMSEALEALKAKLLETEQVNQDLQHDNYDLHDQLNEKMALASTTIAEKDAMEDRHKQAMKNYMLRANAMVEGVLALDNQLYGGRHFEDNPVPEDAGDEEQFYHDYDVGAKVIETLSNDLQRLRGIVQNTTQKDAERAADPRMNLLESDLSLLEQLKQGSLSAVDVAEPVEGLVEAMNGARTEAQQLEHTGKQSLGVAAGREDAIAAVPDTASGQAAEVLAGTTGVVRELAAVMARGRQRLVALKEMADQADEARNSAEQELEEVRGAYHQVLAALAERAKADKMRVPTALVDEDAPSAESSSKAKELIAGLTGDSAAKPALTEHILLMDRLLGEEAGVHVAPLPANAKEDALIARLRQDGAALERMIKEKSQSLGAAQAREKAVAEEIRALARGRADVKPEHGGGEQPLDASIVQLDRALEGDGDPAEAARQVITQLREQLAKAPSSNDLRRLDDERGRLASQIGQAQQKIRQLEEDLARAKGEAAAIQSRSEARRRAEREIAGELVRSAKGDDQLADSVADLALAADAGDDDNLAPSLQEAVTGLARRKQDLDEENQRLREELATQQAKAQEAESRGAGLQGEQQKLAKQVTETQNRVQELERDLSRARTDLDLMRNQAQEANSRRTAIETERVKAVSQASTLEQRLRETESELAKARDELAATTSRVRALDESDRAVATELVRAAQGDPELADTTADLASALEDSSSENRIDSATVGKQVAASIALLASRKQELAAQAERLKQESDALRWQLKEAADRATSLEGERDEFAASGKEIINLLTQQKERTVNELEHIKKAHTEAESQLARYQHRTNAAETANRQLAEALSSLASVEKDQGTGSVEDKRVDLELALSQLPDEGEDAVSIPEDLSLQLASSGQKLAEALLARRQQMTTSFKRAQEDQDALKDQLEKLRGEVTAAQTALDEQQSSLRSSQAEVKAVRNELTNQGRDLASKVQELTNTRGELASLKAELDVAAQRVEEQDRRLQQASAKIADAQREQERLVRSLGEQQQRADAADHAQVQMVLALRGLTNRQDAAPVVARALTDADMADPLSKAAQKLDLARAAGPEQLALAGQAYVQALKDRVQGLAERLEETRGQLGATKASEDSLQNELAALRASVVDRDHQVHNLNDALEKAKAEQTERLNQLMDERRTRDGIAATLKQVQEQLRLAQAEVADYQARDGASSGHFSSDNERLREELERERAQRAEIEAKISELSERAESGAARLKAQRDEFTRRLEERDGVIQQKDRQLDELAAQRGDSKGLEAQVAALNKDLDAANTRIKELEGVHGAHAGVAVKSSDLARELKHLQGERDQLREKLRQQESDLADAISVTAQLKSQLDEKRKDLDNSREKVQKELHEEREKANAMREEFRKLKEEVVGLRARIRRLTDTGAGGSGPSGGFKVT
jgi:chromosome segregation ATPase